MSFFRRVISSLDPLVFFEAAARHQSYSRAARELNVSQVAVSKRIRRLEAEVGRPLFVRQGRTIALTAEGHVFSERIRSGLAFLEDAVHAARATSPRSRQVIQVAANENMNFFRSPVQELFASSIGREVTAPDIRDRFDQALGPGAGEREREREACRDDCSRCLISEITIGLRGDVTGGMLVPGLILASSPTDVGCPAGILDPVGPQ